MTSLGDDLHGAAVARFAHGLLVASAPDSTDAHDAWDPSVDPIHAGPDSLYISVQQAASGPVSVVCVAGPRVPDGLNILFSGEINLPQASLAIYDPNGTVNLQLPVDRKLNRIEVYGDDPDESSEVVIVLSELS
ncbi:hypothetical protein AB0K51_34595 [Kitasatospora sp. NPDC049285]|uniref:hypothetical protein n=1 Tax=Kitasatospora sp. NPDC049285 TaxID=3157096 RepID=UPI003419D3BA